MGEGKALGRRPRVEERRRGASSGCLITLGSGVASGTMPAKYFLYSALFFGTILAVDFLGGQQRHIHGHA